MTFTLCLSAADCFRMAVVSGAALLTQYVREIAQSRSFEPLVSFVTCEKFGHDRGAVSHCGNLS